jgi:hypothetical protein
MGNLATTSYNNNLDRQQRIHFIIIAEELSTVFSDLVVAGIKNIVLPLGELG